MRACIENVMGQRLKVRTENFLESGATCQKIREQQTLSQLKLKQLHTIVENQ